MNYDEMKLNKKVFKHFRRQAMFVYIQQKTNSIVSISREPFS